MADSLPGLGIVAAVLGVVITMGALGGPPEEIGHKVAAALVGTFLGILLCYGLVGPLAANMAMTADDEPAYYHELRVLRLAFLKGISPIMAVEIAGEQSRGTCARRFRKSSRRVAVVVRPRQPRQRNSLGAGISRSSSSRRSAAMADIMGGMGRWPTLTSSRP